MKNILLATDLASSADRAMERAVMLAKGAGTKLHIIHVAASYPVPGKQSSPPSFQEEGENLVRAHLDSFRGAGGVDADITIVQGGEVFAHILEIAHKTKADLIVMGMHGKRNFRDLFIGTTIERVVRKGTRPVLMVMDKPVGPYEHILAGIDFTPASRAALRLAMQISPKAVFHALHTYDMPVYHSETAYLYVESTALAEEAQQKKLDAFLKTEITHFKKENNDLLPRLTGKVMQGPVCETLARKAKEEKADMMTLGAHGRHSLVFSKLGGVAEDVLANPPCDILIARGNE